MGVGLMQRAPELVADTRVQGKDATEMGREGGSVFGEDSVPARACVFRIQEANTSSMGLCTHGSGFQFQVLNPVNCTPQTK